MRKLISAITHEMRKVIPAAIFFFIAFQLLGFTRVLILRQYELSLPAFLGATIGALVVAKVVLVVDMLPVVNRFPEKPLAYNVTWKTLIYIAAAFVVRYVEHLIPFLREHSSLGVANRALLAEMDWARFWVIQIWLLVLFLMYCTLRELIRVLGKDRVRRMFLGPLEPGDVVGGVGG